MSVTPRTKGTKKCTRLNNEICPRRKDSRVSQNLPIKDIIPELFRNVTLRKSKIHNSEIEIISFVVNSGDDSIITDGDPDVQVHNIFLIYPTPFKGEIRWINVFGLLKKVLIINDVYIVNVSAVIRQKAC